MQAPKHAWPDTDGARGVLLFAQLMKEMLALSSFESFRAYTLDTISRLDEAHDFALEIRQGIRIDRAALSPVVEELIWSLEKDPVVQSLAAPYVAELRKFTARERFNLDEFGQFLVAIRKTIDEKYHAAIQDEILKVFSDRSKRNDLRRFVGFYCSYVINLGYSREYISSVVDIRFFNSAPVRVGKKTLSGFFKVFDAKLRNYSVKYGVSSEFGMYLKLLNYEVSPLAGAEAPVAACIAKNGNAIALSSIVTRSTKQLDPYAAMAVIQQEVATQKSISFLSPIGLHAEWGERMLVNLKRSVTSSEIQPEKIPLARTLDPAKPSERRSKNIGLVANTIESNFEEDSAERLRSAVGTAALATLSPNPENQLISLWSAIEVLLSEPRDGPRILHYTDIIVPAIVIRHVHRQVAAVHNAMTVGYRKKFQEIMDKVPDSDDLRATALANCLFIDANVALRSELTALCARNPLALQRLYKLHCDYKNVGAARSSMDEHKKRVHWQVNRLYRARNHIVHAGKVPVYMNSLIVNAAEYLRAAMNSIVLRSFYGGVRYSIDQAASEVKIQYNICRNSFDSNRKQGDPLTSADVKRLLGNHNVA